MKDPKDHLRGFFFLELPSLHLLFVFFVVLHSSCSKTFAQGGFNNILCAILVAKVSTTKAVHTIRRMHSLSKMHHPAW